MKRLVQSSLWLLWTSFLKTNIFYEGSQVSAIKQGDIYTYYAYDTDGAPIGMFCPSTPTEELTGANEYFFVKNLQGDILKVVDNNGDTIITYHYNAWGEITSETVLAGYEDVANRNIFRYRGYIYDTETQLYYLQSRYYDPAICRFLNADTHEILENDDSLFNKNLYIYGDNNPVNMEDQEGEAAANIIGGIVGGATGAVLGILLAKHLGLTGWKRAALIAAAAVGGAVLGAFLGPYVAKLAKIVGSTIKTGVSSFKATIKAAGTAIKHSKQVTSLINNASKFKRTATVMKNVASRPYINSTQTIQNIMRAGKPIADSSLKNGLKWVVDGAFNGTSGTYELVIDVATNTIVHFLFKGSK